MSRVSQIEFEHDSFQGLWFIKLFFFWTKPVSALFLNSHVMWMNRDFTWLEHCLFTPTTHFVLCSSSFGESPTYKHVELFKIRSLWKNIVWFFSSYEEYTNYLYPEELQKDSWSCFYKWKKQNIGVSGELGG